MKYILVCLVVMLLPSMVQGQIVYDYSTGKFDKVKGIKPNKTFEIVTENVCSSKETLKARSYDFNVKLSTPSILVPILGPSIDKLLLLPKILRRNYHAFSALESRLALIVKESDLLLKGPCTKSVDIAPFRSNALTGINNIVKKYNDANVYSTLSYVRPALGVPLKNPNEEDVQAILSAVLNDYKALLLFIEWLEEATKTHNGKLPKAWEDPSLKEELIAADLLQRAEALKEKKIVERMEFIINALTEEGKIVSSFPAPAGDYVAIRLDFLHAISKDTIRVVRKKFRTTGHVNVSFSTGFFPNGIREFTYTLNPTADGPVKYIIKENTPALDVSLGAMLNVTYVATPCFEIGAGLGAALSPLDGITRYMVGPSVLFGNSLRFGLHGGVSIAKTSHLSDFVVQGGDGTLTIGSDFTSVPTYKDWDWGYFAGLTYSIVSLKRLK